MTRFGRLLDVLCLLALALAAWPGVAADMDDPVAAGFRLTFAEEFSALDASARPGSGARWYTRTPWNGDFGEARFKGALINGTFSVADGVLAITLRKHHPTFWTSGLLASMDPLGHGFAQQYGYFEMRAKLPDGRGVWPAFWLIGAERLKPGAKVTAEVDVIEYYGAKPKRFSSVLHVWSRDGSKPHDSEHRWTPIRPGQLAADFNRFGVLITAETTTFYFNGAPYWSVPTRPDHRQPMLVLANLGLGGGWPVTDEADGAQMLIDYIRVYQASDP
ncbi:MAG: glycoside hydrolase family 16 protein [Silicimonas sp.]|nr:glycoside hydrolase family 16 protein [Silicimonas sp.]